MSSDAGLMDIRVGRAAMFNDHPPVMARIARVWLSISAVIAVSLSIALSAVSSYALPAAFPLVYGESRAIFAAGFCIYLALLHPAVGVAIAVAPLTLRATVGAVMFWLILLAANWFTINFAIIASSPGDRLKVGDALLSLLALLLEIVSGYLPALVFMVCHRAPAGKRVAPECPPPAPTPRYGAAPATAPGTATPRKVPLPDPRRSRTAGVDLPDGVPATRPATAHSGFKTIRALLLYVDEHGPAAFPGLIPDPQGGLRASQRTFAGVFGVAVSTLNARIQKEHAAGDIAATIGKRSTRIALPVSRPHELDPPDEPQLQ